MNKTNEQKGNERLARVFFGQNTAARFECREGTTWMVLGRKNGGGWSWVNTKLNPQELGDILCVLCKQKDKASFYHSFVAKDGTKKDTQISVNREENGTDVFFRADSMSKPLNQGEQMVLAVLLSRILYENSRDNWEPSATSDEVVLG